MGLSPFDKVENYGQMLNKIAVFSFVATIIYTVVLRQTVPAYNDLLGSLDYSFNIEGNSIPLGYLLVGFLAAMISRISKLHDRISDLLGIRKRFDTDKILALMRDNLGISASALSRNRLMENRKDLMATAFYSHASSTANSDVIDRHYVIMALDQWCWYWILVEIAFFGLVTTALAFVGGELKWGVVVLGFSLLLIVATLPVKSACAKYAAQEVREILKNEKWKKEIEEVFRALQDKG